jgi:V/A-type H+/Na+-transporting ATPase subunit E
MKEGATMDDEFKRLKKDLGDLFNRIGEETKDFVHSAKEETEKLFETSGQEVKDRFGAISGQLKSQAKDIGETIKKLKNDDARKAAIKDSGKQLGKTFKALGAEMVLWPDSTYQDLIIRLLVKNAPAGDETMWIGKRDEKRLDAAFLVRANEALKKAGKKGEIKLAAKRAAIDGGFILKKDGVEINCSLGAMFAEMGKKFEEDISHIVFGDKK